MQRSRKRTTRTPKQRTHLPAMHFQNTMRDTSAEVGRMRSHKRSNIFTLFTYSTRDHRNYVPVPVYTVGRWTVRKKERKKKKNSTLYTSCGYTYLENAGLVTWVGVSLPCTQTLMDQASFVEENGTLENQMVVRCTDYCSHFPFY